MGRWALCVSAPGIGRGRMMSRIWFSYARVVSASVSANLIGRAG